MFSFFYKKQAVASFEIDHPKFSITPNSQNIESLLKSAGIEYTTVTDGYITFCGKAFDSDIPLMIGIHFNPHKVEFIEIFRTLEYYQSEQYDIYVSFAELLHYFVLFLRLHLSVHKTDRNFRERFTK